jgi:hypothetical protein
VQVIIRQQRGGFKARFDTDTKFAKPAKSREGAIGKLVEANKKRLGISKIRWDMADPWTRNYARGGHNRTVGAPPHIDYAKLPKTASPEDAKRLIIRDLPLPYLFSRVLELSSHDFNRGGVQLGYFTDRTEVELIESVRKQFGPHRFGKKNLRLLNELLGHYGLSTRKSS